MSSLASFFVKDQIGATSSSWAEPEEAKEGFSYQKWHGLGARCNDNMTAIVLVVNSFYKRGGLSL